MNIRSARLAAAILLGVVIPIFTACHRKAYAELEQIDPIDRRSNLPMVGPITRDLTDIKQRGTLTVLAPYNSTTYFIYRGEPLGYEYELLQSFAKAQGLDLKMVVVADSKSLFSILNSGEGDIAANRIVPTPDNETDVSFTRALYRTEPVLVQQEEPPAKVPRKRWRQGLPTSCRKLISRHGSSPNRRSYRARPLLCRSNHRTLGH